MLKQILLANLLTLSALSTAYAGPKVLCSVLESAPYNQGPQNEYYRVEIDLGNDYLSAEQTFKYVKSFSWHYGTIGKYKSIQMAPTTRAMFDDRSLEMMTFAASNETEPSLSFISSTKYGSVTIKCHEAAATNASAPTPAIAPAPVAPPATK